MNPVTVKYTGDQGEVSYELKPGETSVLDQADITKVGEYAVTHKLTAEQAGAILAHREEAAAGFKTRSAPKVPDKYEFQFAQGSVLDPTADREKIVAHLKAQGFSAEQAAAHVKHLEEIASQMMTRQHQRQADQVAQWKSDTEKDKDLGGTNLPVTIAHAKRFLDKFAPKDSPFAKLLNESGFGNHPEVVRLFSAVGKAMAEDDTLLASGGGGSGKKKDLTLAEALYG